MPKEEQMMSQETKKWQQLSHVKTSFVLSIKLSHHPTPIFWPFCYSLWASKVLFWNLCLPFSKDTYCFKRIALLLMIKRTWPLLIHRILFDRNLDDLAQIMKSWPQTICRRWPCFACSSRNLEVPRTFSVATISSPSKFERCKVVH